MKKLIAIFMLVMMVSLSYPPESDAAWGLFRGLWRKITGTGTGQSGGGVSTVSAGCTTALGDDMTDDTAGGSVTINTSSDAKYGCFRFDSSFPASGTLCSVTFMMRRFGTSITGKTYRASVWPKVAGVMDLLNQVGGYSSTVAGATFDDVTIVPVTFTWASSKPSMTLNGDYYVCVEGTDAADGTNFAGARYGSGAVTYTGYYIEMKSDGTNGANYGTNDLAIKMLKE